MDEAAVVEDKSTASQAKNCQPNDINEEYTDRWSGIPIQLINDKLGIGCDTLE